MKIAFIVRSFPTLSETFILNQIVGLLNRGHTVDIYSIYRGNTSNVHPEYKKYNILAKTLYLPNVPQNPILRISKAIWLLLINCYQIFDLAKYLNVIKYGRAAKLLYLFYFTVLLKEKQEYDIIHCHFGICGLVGVALRDLGLLSGKVITSFHGMDVNIYPKLYGNRVYKRLFYRGDLYTVNSNYTSRKLIELGCPLSKVVKLAVGVNISEYFFQTKTFSREETVNILTVGRLVEKKGIQFSIQAVAKVIQRLPHINIQYSIVGEGVLKKDLQTLIDKFCVTQQVKLLGAKTKEEVLHLYQKSHIFILSSVTSASGDKEGQGLVIQEAQASGLPVLSTWHNGIPEGILNEKSGFLVPEKDVDALAERLIYLLEHPEIWAEMGQAGRNFVEKNYDLNMLNDRLVQIYRNLLIK